MTPPGGAPVPIRDAATVILLRREGDAPPRVLMGMRGAGAAFMASKYVFPGGAVDPEDHACGTLAADPRLSLELREATPTTPAALLACVARELEEETGLALW